MIPKDCKRLAEVDFPIAVVSRHAAPVVGGAVGFVAGGVAGAAVS